MDNYNDQLPEIATEKYLIFSSDSLMYGIKAEQVRDIITGYTITYLPRVPGYVRGVINLRGQIIPIVDIRLRLGKPEQDNFCGIVVDVDGSMEVLQDYPFLIMSVVEGDGLIDGQLVKKGDHFILPNGFGKAQLQGKMELIASTM